MSTANYVGRWMRPDEQQRFLQDLQTPRFAELRGIINDSHSREAGDLLRTLWSEWRVPPPDHMSAVALSLGAAVGYAKAYVTGIYWNRNGKFGLFETFARGVHTNAGASAIAQYFEVYPSENFFGWATARGWAGGEVIAGEAFLIRSLPTSDEIAEPDPTYAPAFRLKYVIGWGVGVGVGAGVLPLEWFIELGFTRSIWDSQEGWAPPPGTASSLRAARAGLLHSLQAPQPPGLPEIGRPALPGAIQQGAQRIAQAARAGAQRAGQVQRPVAPRKRGR